MKFYENLWKSMNAMKINKNHANSLEVNGDQLSLVEFTVYWYSLGVLLVSFRSKPKVLQPANPPAKIDTKRIRKNLANKTSPKCCFGVLIS